MFYALLYLKLKAFLIEIYLKRMKHFLLGVINKLKKCYVIENFIVLNVT